MGKFLYLAFVRIRQRQGNSLPSTGFSAGNAHATDYYIARGDPEGETYTPTFTQHGFRYAEVSGLPFAPLTVEAAVALSSHNNVTQGSSIGVGDPVLSKVC